MRHPTPALATAVVLGCIALALAAPSWAQEAKKAPPPPAVSVEVVAPKLFVQRLALTGTVEPAIVAELSSPAEGPVYDCRVREGDRVKTGQTLLGIGRTTSVAANVTAAREELDRKERAFDRFNSLAARNILAADALDQSRAELERARAAVTQAEQSASDYTLKAPWPGIVSRVHVADGKYVAPRTPLVDLFDPQSLVLRFQVPEAHVFAIKQGDAIEARFDAFPGQRVQPEHYPRLPRDRPAPAHPHLRGQAAAGPDGVRPGPVRPRRGRPTDHPGRHHRPGRGGGHRDRRDLIGLRGGGRRQGALAYP